MSEEQKVIESLYRKLKSFDAICFDKCIKDPSRKLGNNEEHCLSMKLNIYDYFLFVLNFDICLCLIYRIMQHKDAERFEFHEYSEQKRWSG